MSAPTDDLKDLDAPKPRPDHGPEMMRKKLKGKKTRQQQQQSEVKQAAAQDDEENPQFAQHVRAVTKEGRFKAGHPGYPVLHFVTFGRLHQAWTTCGSILELFIADTRQIPVKTYKAQDQLLTLLEVLLEMDKQGYELLQSQRTTVERGFKPDVLSAGNVRLAHEKHVQILDCLTNMWGPWILQPDLNDVASDKVQAMKVANEIHIACVSSRIAAYTASFLALVNEMQFPLPSDGKPQVANGQQ